jgi:phosphatidylglycerol---prolipoprotein diacylglyceryl transferase
MYPILFRIGGLEITSFGVMVAVGALVGTWIFRNELRRSHLPESAVDVAVAGLVGGVVGAKLLWVAEHLGDEPLRGLILSRAGMSWFGGFAGGFGAGIALLRARRLPVIRVLSAATPGLAVGHAIGRIGCFLVGDDYGRPSSLPWAVAFPDGYPPTELRVHPTQIYEALALVPVAWLLLRWRGQHKPDRFILGAYLALAGSVRFAIEFLRVDVRVLGPFSVAHIASLGAVITGMALAGQRRPAEETE